MVSIGISEFTYGFAFLFEQVNANWIGVDAAPILPSLQTEQMSGWDVSIPLFGVPFFYQFKIPEYLSAAHATYIADGTYSGPYYRIDLHRRDYDNQHRRLKELAAINPNTFYAAPELNTPAEFTAQFLAQTLVDASRLIPLTDCDDIEPDDDSQHRITFAPGAVEWAFHSTLHRKTLSYKGRKSLHDLYVKSRPSWSRLDEHYAEDLLSRIVATRQKVTGDRLPMPEGPFLPQSRKRREARETAFARLADVLATEFGASMLIAGSRDQP
jgi:hypothetical protein